MSAHAPRSFQLRAAEEGVPPPAPATTHVALTQPRRLLVGPGARDASAATRISAVAADEAVRVDFGDGHALWLRADDLLAMRGVAGAQRGAGGAPVFELDTAAPGGADQRGLLALGIKALEIFGIDLKQATAKGLAAKVDERQLQGRAPGLYRCRLDQAGALSKPDGALPGRQPLLVFLHGTMSNFSGSFGDLVADGDAGHAAEPVREALRKAYADEVYAFEHRTLTESPIANALALAKLLPEDAQLHLVSHSRGGLVGELMALAGRTRDNDPLATDLIPRLFGADAAQSRPPGLPPLGKDDAKALAAAYAADGARLRELIALLDTKHIQVQRFVRVACPARGTTLASGRLDRWLGVAQALVPDSFAGDLLDFLFAVLKERTDVRAMPGIEAMLPGSALARLINLSGIVTSSDLSVIAGDLEAGGGNRLASWWSQLKLFVTDWFYGDDHDLVVNTGSMSGGFTRPQGGARALEARGPDVNHFRYFRNRDSLQWLVAGLTRPDGQDAGFAPIGLARQEAPRWRSAVQRSRDSGAPRPIVIFVPGAMGSSLAVGDAEVWLNYWALLRGGMGRIEMGADVRAVEPLDDFYGPFIEHLAREHRVELFPYDWRLSVRDNAGALAKLVARLLAEAERQGVALHLAAHSMGGIVARTMIAADGALWARMGQLKAGSRLLMLGTPNHGSHEAVRWLTGFNPTQAKLALLDFTRGTDGLVDIVRRYPGLVELLPFGDDAVEGRYGRVDFWRDLKKSLAAGFPLPEQRVLDAARQTWAGLRGTAVDPGRMCYVAGCARATVIDHELVADDLAPGARLAWMASFEGDGTVSWASGRLPGVPVWYAPDTAHDELCANGSDRRLFRGYVDLLRTGRTDQLPAQPPRPRGADARTRFELLQPPLAALPDEASLRGLGLAGGARRAQAKTEVRAPIEVSIRHADLLHARHAVMVGHYVGDLIVSAEAYLDHHLGGALRTRHALGRYPGPSGTHAVFLGRPDRGLPHGAVVVGLGPVGDLTPLRLQAGARDAMLDHAQALVDASPGDSGRRSAALSCLLVGTGGAGLTLRESVESLLRAAIDANRRLERAGLGDRVLIDAIEFVELYEDVAIGAAHALREALVDETLARDLRWSDAHLRSEPSERGRKRRYYDQDRSWDQRIEILEQDGRLSFSVAGRRARAEQQLATGQVALAEAYVQRAVGSTGEEADAAHTLYEMLLPVDFKVGAGDACGMVLMLDERTARFPWELLDDKWGTTGEPLAIAAGMVRQFKTDTYRPQPLQAAGRSMLVIGDPDLEGWPLLQQLPGARTEASAVRDLFQAAWGPEAVRLLLGPTVVDTMAALHAEPWRVLHLAGHGEHEWKIRPDAPARSGMLIGKETFLGPGDLQQLRHVPELVFVNCCHLGRTDGRDPSFSKLAANLGAQLIEMGARAVVAAGWAVDDEAAVTFARSFYGELLGGATFRDAVHRARRCTWEKHRGCNTWGAYQCYGDPGWCLVGQGGTAGAPPARYVSPRELLADLDNLVAAARHRRAGDSPLAGRIQACLDRVPPPVRETWLARADIAAALGFAYDEDRQRPLALEWFGRAIGAAGGDSPLLLFERSLNTEVRQAADEGRPLLAAPASARRTAALAALRARIEAALARFEPLATQAPTAERWSLLGSAHKRLAQLQPEPRQRAHALEATAGHYRRAWELCVDDAYYPLSNWGVACALLARTGRGTHPPADWQAQMHALVAEQLAADADRLQREPDFWRGAAQGDLCLVRLLLDADRPQAVATHRDRARRAYLRALKLDPSSRSVGSLTEHLDFLLQMTAAGSGWPAEVGTALAALRQALQAEQAAQ